MSEPVTYTDLTTEEKIGFTIAINRGEDPYEMVFNQRGLSGHGCRCPRYMYYRDNLVQDFLDVYRAIKEVKAE